MHAASMAARRFDEVTLILQIRIIAPLFSKLQDGVGRVDAFKNGARPSRPRVNESFD